ncbi:MAG: hypothetical protein HY043_11010 [Verrucomicrobia bacterium]|nr:hypothetical protein [Verrucomicrobiota bacterium]
MGWIKKNLFWVVGGLVAVGLLGVSFFYLYVNMQKEKQLDEEIAAKLAKREEAQKVGVPGKDAIEATKQDQQRVEKLAGSTLDFFRPVARDLPKSGSAFQSRLDVVLDVLEKSAEASAVALPPKPYFFTFKPQKEAVQIDAPNVVPLSMQLAEISAICDIIFKSKVNAIDNIRRMPIAKDDVGPNEFHDKKAVTNALTIHVPYEFTFRGLSSELAAVLDGLAKSPYCFLIKALNIEISNGASATSVDSTTPGAPPGPMPGHDPFRSRYGALLRSPGAPAAGGDGDAAASAAASRYSMMQRYGRFMQPQQPETPPPTVQAPKGPSILLDEKQLRVTMTIEAVRLKDSKGTGGGAATGAAGNPPKTTRKSATQADPTAAEGGN